MLASPHSCNGSHVPWTSAGGHITHVNMFLSLAWIAQCSSSVEHFDPELRPPTVRSVTSHFRRSMLAWSVGKRVSYRAISCNANWKPNLSIDWACDSWRWNREITVSNGTCALLSPLTSWPCRSTDHGSSGWYYCIIEFLLWPRKYFGLIC